MANVALVTSDVAGVAAVNTQTALVNNGHTVTQIDDVNIATTDFSAYDVIVAAGLDFARRATNAPELRAEINAGKPLLIGFVELGMSSTGTLYTDSVVPLLRLMSRIRIWSGSTNVINGIEIINNTHPITDEFALGEITINASNTTSGVKYVDGDLHTGTILAHGDPTANGGTVPTRPNLFVVEEGTLDIDGVALNARVVYWGSLFANPGAYTANGEALIGAAMEWLVPPLVIPAIPENLAAVTQSHQAISVTWDAAADAISYELRRSLDQADWTVIEDVTSPYADNGLEPETQYFYQVRSVNGDGASDWSASVNATTDIAPDPSGSPVSRVSLSLGVGV